MDLVAIADGNFTTAATWGTTDTTRLISTNTGATALTTGTLDSATFTPGAITVQGVCVRIASRATGSPSNTMTVTLRNSTTATNIKSVTVNVSLLPVCSTGTDSAGGWVYLKFDASVLLVAGNNYLIRATLSSTSTAVSLATNGTANNWQHMLVTTTTQAPAAGDDMHVMGTLDGAANPVTTMGARAVDMDSTAATDYGSAQTNTYVAALDVSTGGTFAYKFAAATNYVLRLSGHLKVYSGGVFSIGTVANPIPRGGSAVLEFDCAADSDFGAAFLNGSTVTLQGLSRTSGKNVSKSLLTADAAAAATSLTTADDTGWLNGDQIALASTSQTATHAEDVALGADASGTSLPTVGALTNAHLGTATTGGVTVKMQAEVLLLTRNVIVRSVSSTATMAFTRFVSNGTAGHAVSTFDVDWVQFRYTQGVAISVNSGTSLPFDHCVVWGFEGNSAQGAWTATTSAGVGASDTIAIRNCGAYHILSTAAQGIMLPSGFSYAGTGDRFVIDEFVYIGKVAGGGTVGTLSAAVKMETADPRLAIGALYGSSASYALWFSSLGVLMGGRKWGPIYTHSHSTSGGSGNGILFGSSNCSGLRFGDVYSWRNGARGIQFASGSEGHGIRFEGDTVCIGNGSTGVDFAVSANSGIYFKSLRCAGDSSFAQPTGITNSSSILELTVDKGSFGVAGGILVAHSTRDLTFSSVQSYRLAAVFRNTVMASATELNPTSLVLTQNEPTSYLAFERKDGTAGAHETWTPLGKVAIETTTVQDSPAIKLTPSIAANGNTDLRLESGARRVGRGYMVPVLNGNTVQVAVGARKDGSYAGNQPRLIVKANPALGIDSDTVLATMTVGASTWETLTGTTAAVTDDGVLEFVVDCDGSAGNVFVNQWASGTATPAGDEQTWFDGLAFRAGAAGTSSAPAGGGGGSGGTRGYAFT
jgi:hypothetical protein